MSNDTSPSTLQQVQDHLRPVLRRVFLFGVLTSLLALAPSYYMMEVYGRVVGSRSTTTLAMLTLLVIAAYAWMEFMDWVRCRLLLHAAREVDGLLAAQVFEAIFRARLQRRPVPAGVTLGDLAQLRSFLASPGMLGLLDAPFALVVLLILYILDPWLGLASTGFAAALALVGLATDRVSSPRLRLANQLAGGAQAAAAGPVRQAPVVAAMGMMDAVSAIWRSRQAAALVAQARASDQAGLGAAASKLVQTLQGSLLLGLGCWLTLRGTLEPTGSVMILASILGARVLAPITQVITHWRSAAASRDAWGRVRELLAAETPAQPGMPLPAPKGHLQVQGLRFQPAGASSEVLRGVQFAMQPGQLMAVIGPSAAGKTTLARLLVGIWPATAGKVRLDGADVATWHRTDLGRHVGYLPQGLELLEGTLGQNICRFGEPDPALLELALEAMGLRAWAQSLPRGVDTPIGVDGTHLSGGMRQRVALARALYGEPRLLVLDEPGASLDEEGVASLVQALLACKARGATIVVATHQASLLAVADLLLVLHEGTAQAVGPRDEVIRALRQGATASQGTST